MNPEYLATLQADWRAQMLLFSIIAFNIIYVVPESKFVRWAQALILGAAIVGIAVAGAGLLLDNTSLAANNWAYTKFAWQATAPIGYALLGVCVYCIAWLIANRGMKPDEEINRLEKE